MTSTEFSFALPADIEAARTLLVRFLSECKGGERLVALHDSDADGVSSGVLWQRAVERLKFSDIARLAPNRERNAWTESNRALVAAQHPQRLFVLDLGAGPHKVLSDVPTCFIDHHRPEGIAEGDTLISAYTWNPIPNTSLLFYDLCRDVVDLSDLDWIAAIGTFGDLGERAPFDLIASTKKKYTAKYLKEATALLNAARRASHYDPEIAARALLESQSPRELVDSDSPSLQQLHAARAEVKAALEEAKKAAPVFAGKVALIRVSSPCQIHPLVAQIWRTRLPKFIVMAANDAYLPGRINFSARGEGALQALRAVELPGDDGQFGHGHDAASGGSLPIESWNLLLEKLGFDAEARA